MIKQCSKSGVLSSTYSDRGKECDDNKKKERTEALAMIMIIELFDSVLVKMFILC